MPIVQIFVDPTYSTVLSERIQPIAQAIEAAVQETLAPAPDMLQISAAASLAMPRGRRALAIVHHRASPARDAARRQALAHRLRDILERELGASARVRVLALANDEIAASDSVADPA